MRPCAVWRARTRTHPAADQWRPDASCMQACMAPLLLRQSPWSIFKLQAYAAAPAHVNVQRPGRTHALCSQLAPMQAYMHVMLPNQCRYRIVITGTLCMHGVGRTVPFPLRPGHLCP